MTADREQPYVDPLSHSDTDLQVYEAVATLEYLGRPVTRAEIAASADLPAAALDRSLEELTQRGMLIRSDSAGEPSFEPAQRGWSATPGEPQGPNRL